MSKSRLVVVACFGALLCGAAALVAANEGKEGKTAMAPTSETFVKKAGEANLAEVAVSKLAQTKAQSDEVKKFADQMVKDHTKASSELSAIAKDKSLTLPKDVSPEHKAAMEALKSKSGAEFDAAFMAQMKKDHDKAVTLFQSASASSDVDPALQAFAKKTLPTLEHHQHMAGMLNTKMASAASGTSTK